MQQTVVRNLVHCLPARQLTAGAAILAVLLAAVGPASAQATFKRETSPAAPGDLSRPAFDTTTPAYDITNALEKSAATVVAEIDGRAVTLGDVGDAIRELPGTLSALPFETLFPVVLDRLIKQHALVIRAHQQGIDERPDTKRRVRAAAEHALANAVLRTETSNGITETMLLDRYKATYAGKPGPVEVRARIIMVPTEKEAAELIAELKSGADFASVARRASKDSTAPAGGDLGFLPLDSFNPELGAVAFALPVGQLSTYPVRSAGSWFVLKTEDRRQVQQPPFAVVREQIRESLLRDAVPTVTDTALAGVVVREYTIGGKETEESQDSNK